MDLPLDNRLPLPTRSRVFADGNPPILNGLKNDVTEAASQTKLTSQKVDNSSTYTGVTLGEGHVRSALDVTYQNLNPSSSPGSQEPNQNDYNKNTDDNHEQAKQQKADTKEQAELALIQDQITQLAARDREVRAHEQAHMAAGGPYAGAASYTYERGPDGVNYAIGGEVPIDVSPAATPAQTIEKAQVVKRAALAPAEPSPQDRKVASLASAMEQQARAELLQERNASQSREDDSSIASDVSAAVDGSIPSALNNNGSNAHIDSIGNEISQASKGSPSLTSRATFNAINTLNSIQSSPLDNTRFTAFA